MHDRKQHIISANILTIISALKYYRTTTKALSGKVNACQMHAKIALTQLNQMTQIEVATGWKNPENLETTFKNS
ncbi:hypothetical protein [Synechococcus sp. MU1625]|uniref:hypothetical protein n=1 Tax=Synechococcus sp. MU1625 TaxID=2508347 RepID=UPI001CF88ED4|nr:hypothetical protein [Synechococcus sp. MU1625]MCB4399713.1 hypothetical protein [Synechococcus sp. MU1625]